MILAESIVHTLDPFLFRITAEFGPRWYGLAYAAGFLVAWGLARWLAKSGRVAISTAQAADLVTILAIGVLAGGRIGHILFYEPKLLVGFSGDFPFWDAINIAHGGMSSHGGMIGVGVAAMWSARRMRLPFLAVGDIACFAAPIGLGLGRLANWVNGELLGKALPETMQGNPPWWSVKYPSELLEKGFANADRLAALSPLRSRIGAHPGDSLAKALFDACYRHDAEVLGKVAPLLTARYPINFMQAFTDGVLLMLALVVVWLRPRPAGTLMGWFMLVYGALRCVTEAYREPDPDVLHTTVVTMPVLLSLSMCMVGLALLLRVRGRGDRHGGLLSAASDRAVAEAA